MSARAQHSHQGKRAGAPVRQGRKKARTCPICGKPQVEEYRPFCSKRCADIDLGRWLEGRYAVPGAPVVKTAQEEDEEDR